MSRTSCATDLTGWRSRDCCARGGTRGTMDQILRASAASSNVSRPTSPWHLLAATAEEGPANCTSKNSSTMPTQRFSRRGMSYHPVRQRARSSLCLATFWADGPAGDFVFGNTIVAPRDDRLRSHIALSAYWLTIQW